MTDAYAIMCLVCKDGYGGDSLDGAKAWIEKHNHPEPDEDDTPNAP